MPILSRSFSSRLPWVVALAVTASCSDTPPTSPQPSAQLQMTASPSQIAPILCPASSCGAAANQLEALTTVTIRETAGVGGRVTGIAMSLRLADNTIAANGTFTPTAATRFERNGSAVIPVGVHYERSHGAQSGTLTLTLSATDDNGHSVGTTLAVAVLAFGG